MHPPKWLALVLVAVAVCVVVDADASAHDLFDENASVHPAQILVRIRDGGSPSDVERLGATGDVSYNETLDVWRIDLPASRTVGGAVSELAGDPAVVFAQPNYVYHDSRVPDDPEFHARQRAYYGAINAEAGWSVETGSSVIVAVLDAGIDISHSELDSKIWTNAAEVVNGMDEDGNGCIDDVHGCDFLSDTPAGDITDLSSHGTFVAGIIGAEADNGMGVAGLAWGATIMPVRVLDAGGVGTTERLASGILYAAQNGAAVENMSLSLTPEAGECPTDPLVDEALKAAHDDYGAVIAAAAGNEGIDCVSFPAASPYTIGVGGSSGPADPDRRAFFSQWGPEIDVAAPAIDIYSTLPGDAYGSNLGTSFATPLVAGLSALLISQDATRSNEDVREIMRDTARDVPDESSTNWDGAGIIDVGAALGSLSAFGVVDASAAAISGLSLDLTVGHDGAVDCTTTLWSAPSASGQTLHGSFGSGDCAEFWPPSVARPWRVVAGYSGPKAAAVNAFSVTDGVVSCAAEGVPSLVQTTASLVASVDCSVEDRVSNDSPEQAMPIELDRLPQAFTQDLQYATSANDPAISCADEFSRSVWFRLEAGEDVDVAIDTFGSSFDTVLAVYSGPPGDFDEIVCSEDFGSPQSRIVLHAAGATEYYVMAAALQHVSAGWLQLNINRTSVPVNDIMAAAEEITPVGLYPLVQPAHSARADQSDPPVSCVPSYGFSLWFKTSPDTETTLIADTEGSTYDTVLGVFKQEGGDLVEVACNDDDEPGDRTSNVAWDAAAGADYFIVVGAFSGRNGGALRLSVTP